MWFAFAGLSLFTREIKRVERWTDGLEKAWRESLQECGLNHLKLRSQADGDLSECLCWWHFPSLAGIPAGTQPLPGDGAFWGREQGTQACEDPQEMRTKPTAPAFKELSGWETESTLPTHLVVICTESTQGSKGRGKICSLWIPGRDSTI